MSRLSRGVEGASPLHSAILYLLCHIPKQQTVGGHLATAQNDFQELSWCMREVTNWEPEAKLHLIISPGVFVVSPSDAEHHQRAQRRRQRRRSVQQIQHHQGPNRKSLLVPFVLMSSCVCIGVMWWQRSDLHDVRPQIQKVVNKKLRERYTHRQKEIADENHNHHNERMLFHGNWQ